MTQPTLEITMALQSATSPGDDTSSTEPIRSTEVKESPMPLRTQIQRHMERNVAIALALVLSCLVAGPSYANPNACGELNNHYGPYDYRTAHSTQIRIVEGAHFTRGVETLTKQSTTGFGGDISYTLKVFPNHYRALLTYQRLAEKEKRDPPREGEFTVECFFERGLRFVPKDPLLRMLYVSFLIGKQRDQDAMLQLDYVVNTNEDDPSAQFNAGMLFMDMKQYARALAQAHKVIAMGISRPELRERLTAAGEWVEPPPNAASAAPVAASAASQ